MQAPLYYRKDIPFFYDKSEAEFSKDVYERYDEMVTRQTALHLADELWNGYPMQPVEDFLTKHLRVPNQAGIVELGCSVGRVIGRLAQQHPDSQCWGIDYSYQLLKRAKEFWLEGTSIRVDCNYRGLGARIATGQQLKNLQLGLAKAESLPFNDNSQDVLLHSFLFDRLQHPQQALLEMHRVLKKRGQLLFVTPLNYNKAEHWNDFYPTEKLKRLLQSIGFEIDTWEENCMVIEPMDAHGNVVLWKCLAAAITK